MGTFQIEGGHKLKGEITPQGAKNEALQILCAVLLTPEKIHLDNVPDILDVNMLITLLEDMGVAVKRLGGGKVTLQAENINLDYLRTEAFAKKSSKLRGVVMMAGPLLARYGKAYLPQPGGDKIGRRRLDTHILGFEKLGVNFAYNEDNKEFVLDGAQLKGNYILLEEPSVTGTGNIIMAAVLAEGTTTIYNAACEPYIQQLCKMLNSMGAKITGIGSNLLTIEGVTSLKGCRHRMLADMIEVGSFIALAAMTKSEITIKDADVNELGLTLDVFKKFGVQFEIQGNDIYVPAQEK